MAGQRGFAFFGGQQNHRGDFAPAATGSDCVISRISIFYQERSFPRFFIGVINVQFKKPGSPVLCMSRMENDGLRIIALYERRKLQETTDPEAVMYHGQSLRVDGQGIIPRAGPNYCVQIAIKDDPKDYRFPVPAEFNKRGFFVIRATELPVPIPYGADVKISIIETDRKGEKILTQSPLRYRTV